MMDGAAFWREVFGDDAPVEIEIGSGDGVFLLTRAAALPDRRFLGIERSPSKARRLDERVAARALRNVRTLQADAACVVASLIPDASVAVYHVYFPDPWPKRGHASRRIFTAPFVAEMARTLVCGGRLYVATDVAPYASIARGYVVGEGRFREIVADERHPGLETSFARKYRAGGRVLHTLSFVREAAQQQSAQPFAASKIRSM